MKKILVLEGKVIMNDEGQISMGEWGMKPIEKLGEYTSVGQQARPAYLCGEVVMDSDAMDQIGGEEEVELASDEHLVSAKVYIEIEDEDGKNDEVKSEDEEEADEHETPAEEAKETPEDETAEEVEEHEDPAEQKAEDKKAEKDDDELDADIASLLAGDYEDGDEVKTSDEEVKDDEDLDEVPPLPEDEKEEEEPEPKKKSTKKKK
jgi:hypothetical protein